MLTLVLLYIAQISAVWGLAVGARLETWFIPSLVRNSTLCFHLPELIFYFDFVTQAASMSIAMEWTELKSLNLLTWASWVTFLYNALLILVLAPREEFWNSFQPAFVTLPLLLAVDLKSI